MCVSSVSRGDGRPGRGLPGAAGLQEAAVRARGGLELRVVVSCLSVSTRAFCASSACSLRSGLPSDVVGHDVTVTSMTTRAAAA